MVKDFENRLRFDSYSMDLVTSVSEHGVFGIAFQSNHHTLQLAARRVTGTGHNIL